jgi:hypothetical protein|tara:strand:+ start:894 stop:1286 length:393 start_codon:yes stop_codon:yes gene_type:complete
MTLIHGTTTTFHSNIKVAWKVAQNLNQRKKHVSIITQNNQIVSIAGNGFEVPSRYMYRGYRSLHSEIHAFMKLNCSKDNLALYNYRFNNAGKLRMAKPCHICMPWCEAIFTNIVYSTTEGNVVELKGLRK